MDQGQGGGDDQFNVEDLLAGTPERVQQQRDDFEDISEYEKALTEELEVARIASLQQHKEDEKLCKAAERMKFTGEGSSRDPSVASCNPLWIPPQQQQQEQMVIPEVPVKEHRPGKCQEIEKERA